MKKILFLAALTVAALSSCSKNEVFQNEAENNAVSFGLYSSNATRATVTDNTSIEDTGFGVFGYFHDNGAIDWASAKPNFMYDQEVEYSGGAWTYSPVKYWSNDANDRYSFFGYAPYGNTAIVATSANNATGAPVITYTMPADRTTAPDFVAGQVLNTGEEASVTINMKHQLTRFGFSVNSNIADDDSTVIVIKSINLDGATVKVPTIATYKFNSTTSTDATDTEHGQDGTWDWEEANRGTIDVTALFNKDNAAVGSGTPYPAGVGKEIPCDGAYHSLFGSGAYQFIIPPAGATGIAAGDLTLTMDYDILTTDSAVENGYTFSSNRVAIPLGAGALAQGKAYNYQITIELSEVILTPNVVEWDDVGNITGTGSETSGIPTTLPTAP